MKTKKMQQVEGFGVVGTWVAPKTLGGALPFYICETAQEALDATIAPRLLEFIDQTELWLCEITIKPIRKVELKTEPKFQ